MHMIVIGNGFDLAHGLPTKYTHFLRYCRDYKNDNPISESDLLNEEFVKIIDDNIWIKYFLDVVELDDEKTWIDFEKEIAYVIDDVESRKEKSTFLKYVIDVNVLDTNVLVRYIYLQLKDFVRAFEIYCLKINEISVKPIITTERKNQMENYTQQVDIYTQQARRASGYTNRKDEVTKYEMLREEARQKYVSLATKIPVIDYLSLSKFDCVLSFNYTKTYERLYGNEKTKYCYIHGKAQENPSKTNLILGVNDELEDGAESKNFTWINFKKYYQRIIFKTGSEYKDWLTIKTQYNSCANYVHIIGHSLDKTDYEILYEIFTSPDFKIIVYYYNETDFEEKVQRVIQLLAYKNKNGRDELIRRVHGSQWSIKFVNQYDEVDGLFIR